MGKIKMCKKCYFFCRKINLCFTFVQFVIIAATVQMLTSHYYWHYTALKGVIETLDKPSNVL